MLGPHAQRVLSERQYRIFDAVDFSPGAVVVAAAAGSGKTRTAVEVVLKALVDYKHLPVAVVTMTRTAKDELVARLTRVAEEIGLPARQLDTRSVRTIHSIALNHVKTRTAMTPGMQGVEVVDKPRLKDLMTEALEEARSEVKEDDIPDSLDVCHPLLDSPLPAEEAVCLLIETRSERLHACMPVVDDSMGPVARSALEKLEARLTNTDGMLLVDYDSMIERLRLSKEAIVPPGGVLALDEVQDMSRSQLEIIINTLKKGASVIMFGDDSQGIFQFSGACSRTMEVFKTRALDWGFFAKTFPLMQNHRSTEAIVRASEAFLPDDDKAHRTQVRGNGFPGEKVEVLLSMSPEKMVANRIVSLIKDGMSPGEMVVIRHKNWAYDDPLIQELRTDLDKMGVRISVPGQTGNLAERFMCVMRAISTDREMDEDDIVAFLRSIHGHAGVGDLAAPSIAETLQGAIDVLGSIAQHEDSLVTVFKRNESNLTADQPPSKKPKTAKASGDSRKLANFKKVLKAAKLAVSTLRWWASEVNVDRAPVAPQTEPQWNSALNAEHPLGIMAHMVLAYLVKKPESDAGITPQSIVECCDIKLRPDESALEAAERAMSSFTGTSASADKTLRFSTIHRIKGREARCVFVCDLKSPYAKTSWARRASLLAEHLPGCHNTSGKHESCCEPFNRALRHITDAALAENRRLQYVAASRATERLFLVGRGHYGLYLDTLGSMVSSASDGEVVENRWVRV